jgi:hypothetical protein
MSEKKIKVLSGSGAVGAAIATMALTFAQTAFGVIINPGQTLPTTGGTSVGGALLLDTTPVPFVGKDIHSNIVFTGSIDSKVYADTQGLDFVYQFSNDQSSPDAILHLAASSFSGYITDADYIPGTGATAPSTVSRDAAAGGDTVDFNFALPNLVLPGTTSDVLVIKTNATSFALGNVSLQDGGNATLVAPAPVPVPEPAAMALLGMGICGLASRRRRNR